MSGVGTSCMYGKVVHTLWPDVAALLLHQQPGPLLAYILFRSQDGDNDSSANSVGCVAESSYCQRPALAQ